MNIGLDAKRYFHNSTGLGNYSRTLVNGMAEIFPEHDFFLFNPKPSVKYRKPSLPNIHEILPEGFPSSILTSLWRSTLVKKDLARLDIDLYHGLSHEIPVGVVKTGIPSVVTIHDLIFERYPEQFKKIDVQIYRRKFKYACHNANRIIAISNQTREDIINLYGIAEDKIDVCYQSCHPAFSNRASEEEKQEISHQYSLPQRFFLYVGSIIERKNLLNICKAIKLLEGKIDVPLVVIGNGKKYKEQVKLYINQEKIGNKIIFLSEKIMVDRVHDLHKPESLAVIYQMAEALIYPSFFEGFGIPLLEALWSKIPVITSNVSSLPEAGGEGAIYLDPSSPEQIANAMSSIINDETIKENLIEKGWMHAQNFTLDRCCRPVMDVYKKLVS